MTRVKQSRDESVTVTCQSETFTWQAKPSRDKRNRPPTSISFSCQVKSFRHKRNRHVTRKTVTWQAKPSRNKQSRHVTSKAVTRQVKPSRDKQNPHVTSETVTWSMKPSPHLFPVKKREEFSRLTAPYAPSFFFFSIMFLFPLSFCRAAVWNNRRKRWDDEFTPPPTGAGVARDVSEGDGVQVTLESPRGRYSYFYYFYFLILYSSPE